MQEQPEAAVAIDNMPSLSVVNGTVVITITFKLPKELGVPETGTLPPNSTAQLELYAAWGYDVNEVWTRLERNLASVDATSKQSGTVDEGLTFQVSPPQADSQKNVFGYRLVSDFTPKSGGLEKERHHVITMICEITDPSNPSKYEVAYVRAFEGKLVHTGDPNKPSFVWNDQPTRTVGSLPWRLSSVDPNLELWTDAPIEMPAFGEFSPKAGNAMTIANTYLAKQEDATNSPTWLVVGETKHQVITPGYCRFDVDPTKFVKSGTSFRLLTEAELKELDHGAPVDYPSPGRTTRVIDWVAENGSYRLWNYSLDTTDPLPNPAVWTHTWSSIKTGHELIPVSGLHGSYVIDWVPDDGSYRLWGFDASTDDVLPEPEIMNGSWSSIKSGWELVPIGDYVLVWQLSTGEYSLYRFDPSNKDDVLPDPPVQSGTWSTISSGHELIPLSGLKGTYVLDWEPSSGDYRLYEFDPNSHDPLPGSPVASGSWSTIGDDQEIVPVGNHVFVFTPRTGGYRLYAFDPMGSDPLPSPPVRDGYWSSLKTEIRTVFPRTLLTHRLVPASYAIPAS